LSPAFVFSPQYSYEQNKKAKDVKPKILTEKRMATLNQAEILLCFKDGLWVKILNPSLG